MRYLHLPLALLGLLAIITPANAKQAYWNYASPNHGQTYAYGSEVSRTWMVKGPDNHLAVAMTFDNGPWASGGAQRTDYFTFNFPRVTLGKGGNTFFYHTHAGDSLVVARKESGFFGGTQIKLLPTAFLHVQKVHGYLTMTLVVSNDIIPQNDSWKFGITNTSH